MRPMKCSVLRNNLIFLVWEKMAAMTLIICYRSVE